MKLGDLSDEEVLSRLESIRVASNRLLAQLLCLLIEVEDRRLDLQLACSSLFDFCRRRLGLSEGATFRRITAARLVARFPSLLGPIERGEIHLTSVVMLRDVLTNSNVDDVVKRASGKSKRAVEELVASLAPRADVPSKIRKLPSQQATMPLAESAPPSPPAAPPAPPPARVEALAPERYKVQLTASRELRDKIERAVDLMRHRNPTGDLAVVVERALDALLEKLEKERFGKTDRPQRASRPSAPGRVPNAVRREVSSRDAEQCTYVSPSGDRCESRAFLEFDHEISRAKGGPDETPNIRLLCRAHNRLHAEEEFGKSYVERQIHLRQQKSIADIVTSGLVGMGFTASQARRAVTAVATRYVDKLPPPPEFVREALAVLR